MLNEKGLSLVEVMVALLVLLFVSLALMQTALVSIESNMKNTLRDEAVSIAEGKMSEAKHLIFNNTMTNLKSDGYPNPDTDVNGISIVPSAALCPPGYWSTFGSNGVVVRKNLKKVTNFNFCTNRTVTENGGDGSLDTPDAISRQVSITVGWTWKGEEYSHMLTSMVERSD
ncbi:MAG: prepilin-type N-terminal cleavage/methylation domain-containing protein [Nitrospiraceae bacterium]|nr:prepilin-type N-terminal cleavage/methylation domain-containing protein [Nitrospiraceae bacterium]